MNEPPVFTEAISSFRYQDLDQMADAIGIASAEFIPTEPGGFEGSLLHADLGRLSLEAGSESQAHLGRAGTDPRRALAFFLLDSSGRQTACGHELAPDRLMLYRPGSEYQGVSGGSRRWAGVLVPLEDLTAAVETISGSGSAPLTGPHRLVEPEPQAAEALRRTVADACAAAEQDPSALATEEARRGLERSLLAALARAVASGAAAAPPGDRTRLTHARVVGLADEFLRERLEQPIYVADLCRATGVSERTLRNAFREMYGIGPNRFLKLRRLRQVRRTLSSAAPGTRVSAVAARHGFWDLGRFAGDYRALFAESPSETLRRGHRREAGPSAPRPG